MAVPEDWYPHRRADGEGVGWIVPDGDDFRAVDLLGRAVGDGAVDWIAAEELLEERGIGYLADRWVLTLPDGSERPVRIAEASADGITVVADEFGAAAAVGANADRFLLPFPAPATLVPAAGRRVD